jgi:hypothetical protein
MVQLFSAVFEVYARNIPLIASFRAEIAKLWSLEKVPGIVGGRSCFFEFLLLPFLRK